MPNCGRPAAPPSPALPHKGGGSASALCSAVAFIPLLLLVLASAATAQQQPNPNVRPPAGATIPGGPNVVQPERPGNYDVEMWRKVRGGLQGQVTIPDKKAGTLVQSDGELWRNFRNGPLLTWGAWAMGGMIAALALFFALRGRITVEHGLAGRTIERFTDFERMAHWLMAVSFVILALTGLNILYGRAVLLPLIGKDAFAAISIAGKWAHNYVAFAFMAGLVLAFVRWVALNFPNHHDIVWLLKGGGMFTRGSHPPARKFNAGQKILFWLVVLGGISISLSGLAMMFPFQMPLFGKTFAWLNGLFGLGLPTPLTPVQEMQYATSWHAIVGLGLICVIFAHIYIGTIGMQGAFDAMGSGQVDVNWAKEHHSIWADNELAKTDHAPPANTGGPHPVPAE